MQLQMTQHWGVLPYGVDPDSIDGQCGWQICEAPHYPFKARVSITQPRWLHLILGNTPDLCYRIRRNQSVCHWRMEVDMSSFQPSALNLVTPNISKEDMTSDLPSELSFRNPAPEVDSPSTSQEQQSFQDRFTLFRLLHAELRINIWAQAVASPDLRIVPLIKVTGKKGI